MNEKIQLFLQKVEEDEALAAKLSAIKNPDEAYAIATTVQDGFTKEEFVAAMEGIRNGDLTADDLGKLAGGVDATATISVSMSVYSGAAAAGGAAI